MLLDGTDLGQPSVLLLFHGAAQGTEVSLPPPRGGTAYDLLWDSAWDRPTAPQRLDPGTGPVSVTAASMRVYRVAGA